MTDARFHYHSLSYSSMRRYVPQVTFNLSPLFATFGIMRWPCHCQHIKGPSRIAGI